MKELKAYIALDKNGKPHIWTEKRVAIYKSANGKDISFMKSKNKGNFKLTKRIIVYSS